MRWNTPEDRIISTKPTHPALVSEADFVAVQTIHAGRETVPKRVYLLAGLLRCGVCRLNAERVAGRTALFTAPVRAGRWPRSRSRAR
jgi:hypothetical protein